MHLKKNTFDQKDNLILFDTNEFAQWHKMWQERLGRQKESKDDSYQLVRDSNPALIPRNHRVEEAIEAAVKEKDYSVMERLLEVLSIPYAHSTKQADYAKLPPLTTHPYQTFCGT